MKSRAFDDAGEGDDDCGGGDIGGVGLVVTRKQMDGNAQRIWVTRAKQVKDEYIFSTIPLRFTFSRPTVFSLLAHVASHTRHRKESAFKEMELTD